MQAARRYITLFRRTHTTPPPLHRPSSDASMRPPPPHTGGKFTAPLRHVLISASPPTPLQTPTTSPATTLSLHQKFLSLSIGFSSGTLGSMCGIGGAVFAIPALVRFTSISSQKIAAGNSLVAVTAVAITGAASFHSASSIDITVAAPLALSASLFTPLGARLASTIDAVHLRRALGLFMLFLAPALPLRDYLSKRQPENMDLNLKEGNNEDTFRPTSAGVATQPTRLAMLVASGGTIGLFSGLLGIGGGSFFTPLIAVTCPEMDFHTVMGTSFLAMTLPTAVGAISYAKMKLMAPAFLPTLIVGACVGARLGSFVALEVSEELLHKVFAVVFAVMGLRTIRAPINSSTAKAAATAARANVKKVTGNKA